MDPALFDIKNNINMTPPLFSQTTLINPSTAPTHSRQRKSTSFTWNSEQTFHFLQKDTALRNIGKYTDGGNLNKVELMIIVEDLNQVFSFNLEKTQLKKEG
ncbi:hypothetical protein O181_082013 [Austropuccinia psidii MF-1]|uniref:Uncharacterized protein n=1 Tax=Austropuccinia psidii MF-1 TaxID=1389203 RepID=A0A9Q3FLP0_9BASI|nr:hypothetical protein [Austropuccinia psidii MF-1]